MQPMSPILICPLNWGLGHATRDIPIIRQYLEREQRVVIAGYGSSLELLKQEFPQCETIHLPGFNVTYSKGKSQLLHLALQVPSFLYWMWKEHQLLKEIIERYKPDLIISDNRYGLWSDTARSIIITHQLKLKLPKTIRFLEQPAQMVLKRWIEKFHECWIPDHPEERSLAGNLSQVVPMPVNAIHIGYLSRFRPQPKGGLTQNYILAIASGPEPQRSIFVNQITDVLAQLHMPCYFITGNPEILHQRQINQLQVINHLKSQEMEQLMMGANLIICRAGYSTLMDLVRLKKGALIIPTPGQTEQEYLGSYLSGKHGFKMIKQSDFNLNLLINHLNNCTIDVF